MKRSFLLGIKIVSLAFFLSGISEAALLQTSMTISLSNSQSNTVDWIEKIFGETMHIVWTYDTENTSYTFYNEDGSIRSNADIGDTYISADNALNNLKRYDEAIIAAGGIRQSAGNNHSFWIEGNGNNNILSYSNGYYDLLVYDFGMDGSWDNGLITIYLDENNDGQWIWPEGAENIAFSVDSYSTITLDVEPNIHPILVSPTGTIEDDIPTFTWTEDPASTWYKLLVWDSSQERVYGQWYDGSKVCSGGSCSATIESELPNDSYEWWVKSWNENDSSWSDGLRFNVIKQIIAPSKVVHTSPSGQISYTTPTFTWTEDPASKWYRLWIGYLSGEKVYAQWVEGTSVCSDGNCSVIPDIELPIGDYEWFVKSWNEDGKIWSDGMSFSVINSECSSNNPAFCTSRNTCDGAGGYWYNNLCNAVPPSGESLVLRVFVAGESVEEFNHMSIKPFADDGTLNNTSNTEKEYGWMVPFADRLHIRDANLEVQWIGSSCWLDQDSWECSTGTYTSQEIGRTSAQAGSTIQAWQDAHNDELAEKQYCYDIAFVSRGGNDLDQGISASAYEAQLRQLVLDLDTGSNCRNHPIIYVTSHLLDSATWNYGYTQDDINLWMANQKAFYVDISKRVVEELNTNGRNVRFIDMWTPFHDDLSTTAFPSETWWMMNANSVRMPDLDKLHRDSSQHPRRLASIFAGENVADQIDIVELWNLLGQ